MRALERVRPADFGADLGPGKGQSQGQGLPPAFLTFRCWQRSQAAVVRCVQGVRCSHVHM